jgi:hypothetical protein
LRLAKAAGVSDKLAKSREVEASAVIPRLSSLAAFQPHQADDRGAAAGHAAVLRFVA